MTQVSATTFGCPHAGKTFKVFNCKICGREMLKVYGNPQMPERIACIHCGSAYRVRLAYPKPQISRARIIGVAVGTAIAGATLGSFITGAWPLRKDPEQVKMDKISKLVGSFTASGFVGLVLGLAAAPVE